jgi:hypothetical protein
LPGNEKNTALYKKRLKELFHDIKFSVLEKNFNLPSQVTEMKMNKQKGN